MIYTMDFVKARNTSKTWKAKYFRIFFMVLFSDLLLTWVSHHQAHLKCSEDQVVSSNLCSPCLWQLGIERHMIRIIKLTFCECLLGKVMWEKNYSHPYFVGNEAQKVTKFDQTYTAGGGLTEGQCYSTHGLCVFSTIKRYSMSHGWCSSVDWVLPVNQRVASSILSQGACLGCGSGPRWGAHERQPHIDVSLPLFLLPFSSL